MFLTPFKRAVDWCLFGFSSQAKLLSILPTLLLASCTLIESPKQSDLSGNIPCRMAGKKSAPFSPLSIICMENDIVENQLSKQKKSSLSFFLQRDMGYTVVARTGQSEKGFDPQIFTIHSDLKRNDESLKGSGYFQKTSLSRYSSETRLKEEITLKFWRELRAGTEINDEKVELSGEPILNHFPYRWPMPPNLVSCKIANEPNVARVDDYVYVLGMAPDVLLGGKRPTTQGIVTKKLVPIALKIDRRLKDEQGRIMLSSLSPIGKNDIPLGSVVFAADHLAAPKGSAPGALRHRISSRIVGWVKSVQPNGLEKVLIESTDSPNVVKEILEPLEFSLPKPVGDESLSLSLRFQKCIINLAHESCPREPEGVYNESTGEGTVLP